MALFKPNEFKKSFFDIDFDYYYNKGFRDILLDIDNTLAPYNNLVLNEDQLNFIENVKKIGFNIYLFSNNSPDNIRPLAFKIGVNYMGHVYKPFSFGYFKFFKNFNSNKNEILCIGDQILTDVVGANIMGLYSIYTDPLTLTDKSITFFSRSFERFLFKFIYKRKHRFNKDYA